MKILSLMTCPGRALVEAVDTQRLAAVADVVDGMGGLRIFGESCLGATGGLASCLEFATS